MDKLLSLCMVVKNEEKVLRRCLESVKTLVDEIIIVDTGSTDNTKAIAYEYTEQVYDFAWVNDFAAARNESICRATGRWILILDADEYVQQDHKEFKTFLLKMNVTNPLGIVLPIMNFTGFSEHQSTGMLQSTAVRLFINGYHLHFTGAIHEQVTNPNGTVKHVSYPSFLIFHSGYTEQTRKEKNKSERNLEVFKNKKDRNELQTPYDFFTLANEYFAADNLKKALYYYEKAYHGAKQTEAFLPHCVERMIHVYFSLERYKQAELMIEEALQKWGEFADFYFLKGHLYDICGYYKKATAAFEHTIHISEEKEAQNKPYWLIHLEYGKMLPYERLASLYFKIRDMQKTVFALTKVLHYNPQNYQALLRLAHLLSQHEQDAAIISFFEKMHPIQKGLNGLMLFKTFILLGHQSLSRYYYSKCMELNLQIENADVLRYCLVTNDPSLFESLFSTLAFEEEASQPMCSVLFLAAVIWNEDRYLSPLKGTSHEQVAIMYKLGQAILKQGALDLNPGEDEHLFSILTDFFVLHAYDAYDRCIQAFANPSILNQLANYFVHQNNLELGLDYYSILLENGEMNTEGYINLTILQMYEGSTDEGLLLLQQALDLNPNSLSLYGVWFEHSTDPERNEHYKSQFEGNFPPLKSLSFIF